MKNLEQIRAKNALEASGRGFKGKNEGDVVKKVPTMIMNNGILASAAFAEESGKGYTDVFGAVIVHLKTIKGLPGKQQETLRGFIEDLCDSDSSEVRRVTAEAMAYLNYLRRFAKK
jgi:CRISPR/Cas system CMR-associated protein Cmr5 small subunit